MGVPREDLLLVDYSNREHQVADLDLLMDYTLHDEVRDALEEGLMTPAQVR